MFWAAPPDAVLVESLATLGQITPALVVETGGRPILAAGSRRAAALRQIRGSALCALAVSLDGPADNDGYAGYGGHAGHAGHTGHTGQAGHTGHTGQGGQEGHTGHAGHDGQGGPAPAVSPALRLGLYYLASNQGRAVTDAMAVAAGRYFAAHASLDDFLRLAGPYLFAADDRRARLVAQWLGLPPELDALLASGHVPLGSGGQLAALDADTRAALTPLLAAVRWSRGSLTGALTWITEAARLAGEPAAALLARCGVLELPHRGLSPNDLTAGLLAGLRRLRYPALTTLEARFSALSRELSRGSRVKLRPSQGFEADAVTFEVTVKSPAELVKAGAALAAMAASPVLPQLLTIAHDDPDGPVGEAPA
nr:chromosome partitioning protein ParB [Solidesulfovibrio aerotolerans]